MGLPVFVDTPAGLAAEIARRFAARSAAAIERHGSFAVAVPGGSVADAILPALSTAAVSWKDVHVFWVDERAVPADHPSSNFAAAQPWLLRLPEPGPTLHPIEAGLLGADDAARDYASVLIAHLGDPPQLDLALLGVGPDGHLASLFPGHPALEEMHRWALAIHDAPKPPPVRVSVSFPVLAAAREIWIVALGTPKHAAVHAARTQPDPRTPLGRLVLRAADRLCIFLDPPAARGD